MIDDPVIKMKTTFSIFLAIIAILAVKSESKIADDLNSLVQETLIALQNDFLEIKSDVINRDVEFIKIWTGQGEIADDFEYLKNLTKHIEAVAVANGQDLKSCNEKKIKQLDAYLYPIEYDNCDILHQDFRIRVSLRELIDQMKIVKESIEKCTSKQPDDLENCVKNIINTANEEASKTSKTALAAIEKSKTETTQCLLIKILEKMYQIAEIAIDYENCTNIFEIN